MTQIERIPVITHKFLMAAKEYGVTMEESRSSPAVIANTFIDACIRYTTDGILTDVDTALLASTCGADAVTKDQQSRPIEQSIDDLEHVEYIARITI